MLHSERLLCALWGWRLRREALRSLSPLLLLEQRRSLEDLAGASRWWRSLVLLGGLPLLEAPGFLVALISEELSLALVEPSTFGDSCVPKPGDVATRGVVVMMAAAPTPAPPPGRP